MASFEINICDDNNAGTVIYNTLTREFRIEPSAVFAETPLGQDDIDHFREVFVDNIQSDSQTVTILPTTNCNARCWYCYEHGISRCDMTVETAELAIRFIKDKYTKPELTINWFGGEPLLRFDIIQNITTKLKENGYQLSTCVTTNGSLLSGQMVEFLKGYYEKVTVNITIDGIKNDYANVKRYTNISKEKAFDTVIRNIHLLIEKNVFVLLRINYDNFERAKSVYKYLVDELGPFDKPRYHIYYAPIWQRNCSLENAEEEALKTIMLLGEGMDINVLANPFLDNILVNSIANHKRLGHCTALSRNKTVINADGRLYRCHSMACDDKYACGDVMSGIDTRALGYEIFEREHEKECGGCALLPLCSTQCRVRSELYGEEAICQNTKRIVPEIARMKLKRNGLINTNSHV